MLNHLRCGVWGIAITLAGFSQPGAAGTGAAVLTIAALLNAAGLSLLQRWRDRRDHELPSSLPNTQEHHRAYS
jgi:multisubunit Na+/H+ antiporter MnhB subunit